ncbi:BTB/POZ domain-containing protein KCTD3, partial [Lamellibrachia satsuma]
MSPCLTEVIGQVVLNAKVLNTGQENCNRMVATTFHSTIPALATREIGGHDTELAGKSLMVAALSRTGKVGVWHAMTQNWQVRLLMTAKIRGGGGGGVCLYPPHRQEEEFPLRMKDTALSVYLTSKTGAVQVILQHPELVMQGPQLFQTFTIHTSCITKVMSAKHV